MDAREEQDLVARARAGEEGAFAALCEHYEGLLAARVRRFVNGPLTRKVSVRDVVQEAWISAHQHLAAFEDRGQGAFGAWLAQIAENKAREAVRRYAGTEKRDVSRERGDAAGLGRAAASRDQASPRHAAETHEDAARLERALARLSSDHQEVLRLVHFHHRTLAEAAEIMGRSYEATKKLYGRAVAHLADLAT